MTTYKTVTGVLTRVPHGGKDGGLGYFFELSDTEFLTICLREGQEPVFNERIALSIVDTADEDNCFWTADHKDNFFKVLS